jgi:hypothetical protein
MATAASEGPIRRGAGTRTTVSVPAASSTPSPTAFPAFTREL